MANKSREPSTPEFMNVPSMIMGLSNIIIIMTCKVNS